MTETKKMSRSSIGCALAAALLTVVVGVGALAAMGVGGWLLYSRHRATASTSAAPSGAPPPTDIAGAVSVLRRAASPVEQRQALASVEQHAARGNAKAMVIAAACCRAGIGMPRNDRLKAFEWHRKAAAAGEPAAMMEMSRYYADGIWVEADAKQSRQWLERAAAAGDAEAKYTLSSGGK